MHRELPPLRLNSRETSALLHPYRAVDNHTNFAWLALEYLTLAVIWASTVGWRLLAESHGLGWWWNVPVIAAAVFLVGGVQHRLMGLAHEASHYTLFKNRLLNELVSDWCCMFPVFATTHQYRLVHLAHHQFTNDWERDPDLHTIGKSKMMHRFPMSRAEFTHNYFWRFLSPKALLAYLWDVLSLSVLGQGSNPYINSSDTADKSSVRLVSMLGAGYFLALAASLGAINNWLGGGVWLAVVPYAFWAAGCLVIMFLPTSMFFQSPVKPEYSSRVAAAMKLTYFTLLLVGFALIKYFWGRSLGIYYVLLWIVPLLTTFPYYMLLRDVFQHGNADDGRLTNTRVFFSDPFTSWAVFVYGQDMHLPHHLFPAIPHYNLARVHRQLMAHCDEYAACAVECDGTFHNNSSRPTVADLLAPDRESSDDNDATDARPADAMRC